ncbi:Putative transmembrane protein (fragment) [uncultured Stenotrophomonas sp.]|uniref:Putative transmembrane protein n=1 Tax=uncultured Stenotrophomonas sp. TaxID=165438 RepID=A0A1Y5Q920_9GAMM
MRRGQITAALRAGRVDSCFWPDQAGEEREAPSAPEADDLPLDAMVRTIGIEMLDALGERPLPGPLQSQGYGLQ